MNASASEQTERTTASTAMVSTAARPEPPSRSRKLCGTKRLHRGDECGADDEEAAGLDEVGGDGGDERVDLVAVVVLGLRVAHPVRRGLAGPDQPDDDRGGERREEPRQHHLGMAGERHRRRDEHDRVDRGRSEQERQRGGGRHAAGDESVARPARRCTRSREAARRRVRPSAPRTGPAGTVRAMNAPGTNAAMAALIPTPSTRNGSACSIVAMKTVPQLCSSG